MMAHGDRNGQKPFIWICDEWSVARWILRWYGWELMERCSGHRWWGGRCDGSKCTWYDVGTWCGWVTRCWYRLVLLGLATLLDRSAEVNWQCVKFDQLKRAKIHNINYLSKSKSQRLRTSSKTDRLRCGKSDESISIAFCETSGVGCCKFCSDFFGISSYIIDSWFGFSTFGSVTFMPKILPGGSVSWKKRKKKLFKFDN